MYAIKSFKKLKGHDGEPLAQGTLHLDNVKVAEWSDDSHGGSMRVDFVSKAEETAFLRFAKTYLAAQPDYDGQAYDFSQSTWYLLESAISSMSLAHEEALDVARMSKKGMCYRALHNGKPEIFSSNEAYTAANLARLKGELGANLIEVFNETLKMPLLDEAAVKLSEQNAHFKKLCKKATLFSIPGPDGKAVYKQSAGLYSSKLAAQLRTKYPTLIEIINERYL